MYPRTPILAGVIFVVLAVNLVVIAVALAFGGTIGNAVGLAAVLFLAALSFYGMFVHRYGEN